VNSEIPNLLKSEIPETKILKGEIPFKMIETQFWRQNFEIIHDDLCK